MIQNMSLDPMGWIECVLCEKFRCDFIAQTCALIAPVQPILHRVSCSNETLTNAPKHYENATKHEFRDQWGGSGAFVTKNSDGTSWHEVFHQFVPFYTKYCYATKLSEMHPNNTKHIKT